MYAHTWMLTPTSRYDNLCMPPVDKSNCCKPQPSFESINTKYERGKIIETTWGRNNHVGGFIRYSIVPLSISDNNGVFDLLSSIFQYNCYAPQCLGDGNNFFNGDPVGTPFNGIKCRMNVKLPDWLPDGYYTMQWRWHSGGDSRNQDALGLTDWVACHDFRIEGGPLNSQPQCPLFIGGDAEDPSKNACEFLKDNVINTCISDTDCYGWYGKAPPKVIMQCPSNILPGGVRSALNGVFQTGQALDLYVGPSNRKEPKPNNVPAIDFASIRAQYDGSPITSSVSIRTQPTTLPSSVSTRTVTRILYRTKTVRLRCSIGLQ